MQAFRNWRWSALAVAFGLTAPVAQAEMITPDSISILNRPSAVGSASGTPVYASNLVTTQYAGLGLNFNAAAITSLNGTSVWAPIDGGVVGVPAIPSSGGSPVTSISYNYGSGVQGGFVSPGSANPTTVSSLGVDIVGNGSFPPPSLSMNVYGSNGQVLPITLA